MLGFYRLCSMVIIYNMKKILTILFLILIFLPSSVAAEHNPQEEIFEARVVEILRERSFVRENGQTALQQNVRLIGLEGDWRDQEVETRGISEIDVLSGVEVKKDDKVLVSAMSGPEGETVFYIIDHVRLGILYWLAGLFALSLFFVGGRRGLYDLLSLAISFLVIMKLILPLILRGYSPLLVSILGAIIILALIVYITWGFTRKANVAILSLAISLLFTGVLAVLFVYLSQLKGSSNEEISYLVSLNHMAIDFRGLLLAGIIIGILGVLDDVVISQISVVEQLRKANAKLPDWHLFKRSMAVGVDHISSMTNTLFLAYAGVSLPLLLLFILKVEPFTGVAQVINSEMIATEIVRTLAGSIGLVLSVPIATLLAVKLMKNKK